uniref:Galanin peptides n=3 Tax=Cyprinus carpio TaxID=7962 RepID=A0A8C1H1F0_CYPCA
MSPFDVNTSEVRHSVSIKGSGSQEHQRTRSKEAAGVLVLYSPKTQLILRVSSHFSFSLCMVCMFHNASLMYYYYYFFFQMHRCVGGVCVSLIVCAFLTETLGMVIAAKEKRGWTLNSAGYLLGPHAIDSHRSLSDKHGLSGKREMPIDEDFKTAALRISDEDVIHTIIDFLSYLKLKEFGALDSLPSSLTSEEISQP